jgi:putative membrane protein
MHLGRKYTFLNFLQWTKRELLGLTIWALIPTTMYASLGWQFLSIPWSLVAVLGTAVALIISFKNVECHRRVSDALSIWSSITSKSMAWGNTVKGYVLDPDPVETKRLHSILFYQHFAWLTALRYQLRHPAYWENLDEPGNRDFMAFYKIPERETQLHDELGKYLPEPTLSETINYPGDKASYILSLQSRLLSEIYRNKQLDAGVFYSGIQGLLNDFFVLQGNSQRIKDFPYARNFYSIALILLKIFVTLVPFALLGQFHHVGAYANLEQWTVWANVPFSVMVMWIFVTLEKVGENSSNPFEGGANDVPISSLSKKIEYEMRMMLGEAGLIEPAGRRDQFIIL